MATRKHFNEFFRAYVTAALWSSNDDHEEPLDANYDKGDITKDSLRKMKQDCVKFMRANKADLDEFIDELPRREDYTRWEQAGHDFWLTRNGHGAGFWDRGVGAVGDRLTKACKKFREVYMMVGDDGRVHCE